MELPVIDQGRPSPWYAEGLKFTCTQCGNCCTGAPGYVWISAEEIRRLAEHLKLSTKQVIAQYCRRVGDRYSLQERVSAQGNYDCVFLKEVPVPPGAGDGGIAHTSRVCTVYAARPLQCRTWPFWDGNLASAENWERGSERCPGMGCGKGYTQEKIEELRNAKDWPESAPGSN
jgi:hypothetical protein